MTRKIILLVSALLSLSACVPTFDFDTPDTMSFNYVPPSPQPLSYKDLMCCYDCQA